MSHLSLPPEAWQVEAGRHSDISFLLDSWCSDELMKAPRAKRMNPDTFKAGQRARIMVLLGNSKLAVIRPTPAYFSLHPEADPRKDLFGWCLYTHDHKTLAPVVHFVYVKGEFRSNGMCDALLHAAGIRGDNAAWCTHFRDHLGRAIMMRGLEFNDFLLDHDPAYNARKKVR